MYGLGTDNLMPLCRHKMSAQDKGLAILDTLDGMQTAAFFGYMCWQLKHCP